MTKRDEESRIEKASDFRVEAYAMQHEAARWKRGSKHTCGRVVESRCITQQVRQKSVAFRIGSRLLFNMGSSHLWSPLNFSIQQVWWVGPCRFTQPGASSTPRHVMSAKSWIPLGFTTAPAWESMTTAWTLRLDHPRCLFRTAFRTCHPCR